MTRTTERTVPLTEMNFRGLDVNSTSGTVTVNPSDSGVMFVAAYTSGTVTYTMPAVADCAGKMFMFYLGTTDYALIIDLDSGDDDKFVVDDSIVGDIVTSAAEVGEWCWIVSDGTYFYVLAGHGTWTVTES